MHETAIYFCDWCGQRIVYSVAWSAGDDQQSIEECPICGRPNVVHVEMCGQQKVRVWAERESD